ncbi:MAG: glycoside hydrolase family 2 protein [Cyclobacteriaceae bacterium]
MRNYFHFFILLLLPSISLAQWQIQDNPLITEWGTKVTPENAWQEYPRPMMVRQNWQNLNGLWDFKISSYHTGRGDYDKKILVPYPVESALSGIKEIVGADNRVWYKRKFSIEDLADQEKLLLHFGAVDWEMQLFLNGKYVGMHQGGYTPFTFDITPFLNKEPEQEIEITVWDPTDLGKQPVGKQTHDPHSIWYTANTGIWQTVWLEKVPQYYIENIKITPDIDNGRVKVEIKSNAPDDYQAKIIALADNKEVNAAASNHRQIFLLPLENVKLWSPDDPFLYDLQVILQDEEGNKVDEVESYFGMRKIAVAQAADGYQRLMLNNKPLFQLGPLDQGWWPDGLYTAASDEALKYDVQVTKDLGFNMLRKHVKVEPQRFYYWCDKLGVLVWQDMPNGDRKPANVHRTPESAAQFQAEYRDLINNFYNHPSIVMWVPFNEGWGQFATQELVEITRELDPTRLVNPASGWFDRNIGDVNDIHRYPGPDMPTPEDNRAAVLGEFGGQALVVEDHLWLQDFSRAPGHYKTSTSKKKLHQQYDELIRKLYPLKKKGLAAAVYTQTTDVETEVNGFMTYDRRVIKFDPERLQQLHNQLYSE